jgi:monoamine oxidase
VRFAGGAQALADGLAARLPPGTVRLGAKATAVRGWGAAGGGNGGVGSAGAGAIVEFEVSDAAGGGAMHVLAARVAVVLALPPALGASAVAFEPPLPKAMAALAAATPTWMAGTAKTVVTFAAPFWREAGLSGSAFDGGGGGGPLSEIYDHCGGASGGPFALFGFSRGAPERGALLTQLVRLFGPAAGAPLTIETLDWSTEPLTAGSSAGGRDPRKNYGAREYAQALGSGGSSSGGGGGVLLLWASTETSAEAAGHIEGALRAADRTVELIVRAAKANGGGS